MNRMITCTVIETVIKHLPTKTIPDDFTSDFKMFAEELKPILLKLFQK